MTHLRLRPGHRGRVGTKIGQAAFDVFTAPPRFFTLFITSIVRATFGDCVFDDERREVTRAGRPVPLSPKAFALLEILIRSAPRAVSKHEIHQELWPDTFVSETSLANLVVDLRAALGDDARSARVVRTLPRFGYAFCADASVEGQPRRPSSSEPTLEHRLLYGRREIALDSGTNLIGREHAATVWINDESVSRRHARIVVDEQGATLEDLGSKNGTFLRGRRVTRPTRLQDGDEIFLGEVLSALRFRTFQAAASTQTARRKNRTSGTD
jgi:DNA-binding winged helix-turn-helix (wHTH) protein